MKPTLYLETTIPSYLAARPSRDLVTAACQKITHDWWNDRRADFQLFVSERVLREAKGGEPAMAAKRMEYFKGIPVLGLTDEAITLVELICAGTSTPPKAIEDAFHIAIAAAHELDFLLTWNCRHIANAIIIKRVTRLCDSAGYECPVICTPQELMGE